MKLHDSGCHCFQCWCERHPLAAEFLIDLALMLGVVAGALYAFKVEVGIQ